MYIQPMITTVPVVDLLLYNIIRRLSTWSQSTVTFYSQVHVVYLLLKQTVLNYSLIYLIKFINACVSHSVQASLVHRIAANVCALAGLYLHLLPLEGLVQNYCNFLYKMR